MISTEDFRKSYLENFHITSGVVFSMHSYEESIDGNIIATEVQKRFHEIIPEVLKGRMFYILLTVWSVDHGTLKDLENCDFRFGQFVEVLNVRDFIHWETDEQSLQFILSCEADRFDSLEPIVKAISGFEVGADQSANVSAHIVSFDEPSLLLNLYDDRGMELLVSSPDVQRIVAKRFSNYVLRLTE